MWLQVLERWSVASELIILNTTSAQHCIVIQTGIYCRSPDHADRPKLNTCQVSAHVNMNWQNFSLIGLAGLTPRAKIHQNGRWPAEAATHAGLPPCKISLPCISPCRRYLLQKCCGQTNTETVNDISSECLFVCGDNNNINWNICTHTW